MKETFGFEEIPAGEGEGEDEEEKARPASGHTSSPMRDEVIE